MRSWPALPAEPCFLVDLPSWRVTCSVYCMATRSSRLSIGRCTRAAWPSSRTWLGRGSARGVIRPVDDETAADLVQALWVIAEMWLALGELDGSYADAEHGTRLLRVVLRPYLTQEGGIAATP
jgi:hypothetical protein